MAILLSRGPVQAGQFDALDGLISRGPVTLASGTATGAAGASELDAAAGVITTESLTTGDGASYTHTITNSAVEATDIVFASVTTAGNGTPVVTKITPAAGSIAVVIQNIHASAAFSAALAISFVVIKPLA